MMNEESLFAAALEKSSADERQAFLEGACAGNDALRKRVERLLAADQHSSGILEHAPDAGLPKDWQPPLADDRVFDGRVCVAEGVNADAAEEVEVFVAVFVAEVDAVAANEEERVAFVSVEEQFALCCLDGC